MCLLVISQSEVRMVGIFGSNNDLLGGFPGGSVGKESACNAGDLGSIPESERSPRERKGCPLQYSYLENPMDRGVWWVTVLRSQRVGHD